ncbi:MAG: acetyl-CoA carboxylase biotin carboxylase subunit [Bacteroidales bacterium]|nr:acetyl-CoA carboxylase biotin carboxylase subunit [Bacteroidales bacterium]
MLKKVLIANRGEIVSRIQRTLKKLNIRTVVLYDQRECQSQYVLDSDEAVCIGKGSISQTFLNISKIVDIAVQAHVDAIHPGYGFLSENADFVKACRDNDIIFIGPDKQVIELMGNKLKARDFVSDMGIPVIPSLGGTPEEIFKHANRLLFPCMIKAALGGGGKAMHIANSEKELHELIHISASEANNYFGTNEVYIEKYLRGARHIEIQILADNYDNVITLAERECSIQRRYQKVIEEAPVNNLKENTRSVLAQDAYNITKESGYTGAGTIEFLLDENDDYYFLEMNTRIQVEHPVSELVSGIDIVEQQINIVNGFSLAKTINSTKSNGHAVEARIYAEDPAENFKPSPGKLTFIKFPELTNVRIDTCIKTGDSIYPEFDPLLAKIIAWGKNRADSILLLKRAINQTIIHGVKTNVEIIEKVLESEAIVKNEVSVEFLGNKIKELIHFKRNDKKTNDAILLAGIYLSLFHFPYAKPRTRNMDRTPPIGFWRLQPVIQIKFEGEELEIELLHYNSKFIEVSVQNAIIKADIRLNRDNYLTVKTGDLIKEVYYSWNKKGYILFLSCDNHVFTFTRKDFLIEERGFNDRFKVIDGSPDFVAPLNGTILKVNCLGKKLLKKGDSVVVIESMKMENEIISDAVSEIEEVCVKEGDKVEEGDLLVKVVTR